VLDSELTKFMEDQILDDKTKQDFPSSLVSQDLPKSGFLNKYKWWFLAGGIILLAGVLLLLVVNKGGLNNGPAASKVLLTIKGPSEMSSGDEQEFKIIYRNGEDADLVNVVLEMIYPSNFQFKSASTKANATGQRFILPLLKSGRDGEVTIRAKVTGSAQETKEIKARLEYKLSNFNSTFDAETSHKFTILTPNLTLDLTGPIDVVNGQDSTFFINYSNVSSQDLENTVPVFLLPKETVIIGS